MPGTQNHTKQFAHTSGITRLTYSPNGEYLFSVGKNGLIRKFIVGSADEPTTIEIDEEDGELGDDPSYGIASSVSLFLLSLFSKLTDKEISVCFILRVRYG